ncbi:MAG: O-antigen ligase family protein [Bacteroidales bacterium]
METLNNLLWAIPLVLFAAFLALLAIDKLLMLTLFLAPLSIQLRFIYPGIPADLFLPTEIFLAMILLVMVYKLGIRREIDNRIFKHPVTVASVILLAWSLITSLTGTMPLVSLKSTLARVWFFSGFFLLPLALFIRGDKSRKYLYAYMTGMILPALMFISKMYRSGLLNQEAAYMSTRPFFNDHTAIGAALAFCVVFMATEVWRGRSGFLVTIARLFLLVLFTFSFVLSYSRAAWLSMAAAVAVMIIVGLRIRARILVPAGIAGLLIILFSWNIIISKAESEKAESGSDFGKHIRSVANVTTDASNLERINRWKSGLRMAAGKPFLGYGPGTYQFLYAPYQMSYEKTIISTNWGEGGNIHSEYLGSLTDSGIPGLLFYLVLVGTVLFVMLRVYSRSESREERILVLGMTGAFFTYIVHGALNNFLDTDKISALFWVIAAAVTALDIRNREKEETV